MGNGEPAMCLVRNQSKYRQSTLATSRSLRLPTKQFTIHYSIRPTYKLPALLTEWEGTQEGTLWHHLKLRRQQFNSPVTVFNWGPR